MKKVDESVVSTKAPHLPIETSGGTKINLADLKGQKVVLYFYPKDNTPGCTTESIEFNKLLPEFKKLNCVVFGISRDSVKSHQNFIGKYDFKFELLSDADEKFCQHFDVIKEKNMYGKKVMGIERSTFVFSEQGQLIKEYRKVKAEGHAAIVLQDLKSL